MFYYCVWFESVFTKRNPVQFKLSKILIFAKGQLISKCLFGVIVWTKKQRKNYQNFCPIEAKTEILVIFSLVFCPNDDTKKTF